MTFLVTRGELHIPLRRLHDDAVLVKAGWHWVRIEHFDHVVNVCYGTASVYESRMTVVTNAPLFAFDSPAFAAPGSAELQYRVLVYGWIQKKRL